MNNLRCRSSARIPLTPLLDRELCVSVSTPNEIFRLEAELLVIRPNYWPSYWSCGRTTGLEAELLVLRPNYWSWGPATGLAAELPALRPNYWSRGRAVGLVAEVTVLRPN